MSDFEQIGQQSETTLEPPRPGDDPRLDLMKRDIQRIVMALETLVVQMGGLKVQLTSIEKTMVEIAVGLGVQP